MAGAGSPSMAVISGEAHSLITSPHPAAATQPAAVTKRDKRRIMLSERLDQMFQSFGQNLRPQYDAQSSAIQVDVHLIMRENPYTNEPLDDDIDTIEQKIQDITTGKVPGEGTAADSFRRDVGKEYMRFLHEVNDAMEEKDINLKMLADKYETTRQELIQRHLFHTKVALGEHNYLAQTVRQRLINQVSKKKDKLQKEKEQLDIGESSALLLHPNHFNLNNPASPGGAHKRATRNTGRRGGEADDSISFTNGRKRKAYNEDNDGQSPAPISKYDPGANGTFSSARARANYTQFEAPVYSFSELFTEAELNMAVNNSAHAAQQYLRNENGMVPDSTNSTNGLDDPPAFNLLDNEADDSTPAAPDMERTTSQSYHQTRGVTRHAANEAAAVARENPLGLALPQIAPLHRGKTAGGAPNYILPLSGAELDADMAIYTGTTKSDYDWTHALKPARLVEYQYDVRQGQDTPSLGPTTMMGGVPMSAQSSMQGYSEAGGPAGMAGAPMSRQGSAMGGVSMKRTASNRSITTLAGRARTRF